MKKWENTLPNSHYISHNVFCDSEPMRLFLNRHRDCLSVLFLGLLKRKQMRILATCVNTISPQVQVESTLLLWLWRSDMFLAAIAYKVFFMTLVMSGHCRDVWSPWQTSWQSTSVTWMRIRIFEVHTASSFGRLCYSRLSSSSDIRSFREVLNRDRAQGRPATSLTLSSQL